MSVRPVPREGGGVGRPWSRLSRAAPLCIAMEVGLLTAAGAAGAAGHAVAPPQPVESLSVVTQQVDPSVVDTITFADPAGTQILGTGIIISSTGLVLTDFHVIRDGLFTGVRVGGRGEVLPASVVVSNPNDDLALIQIEGGGSAKPATLDRAASVRVGAPILAIGNARGRDVAPQATRGRLVALRQAVSYGVGSGMVSLDGILEAAAPIFTGDSGGALLDDRGRVIGVIAAGADDAPCPPAEICPLRLAYAIPIARALAQIGYDPAA